MKFKTKLIFVVILIVGILWYTTGVGAENIGSFQRNTNIQLYQTCNNCTYCNFTRLQAPSNQTLLSDMVASNYSTYYFYDVNASNFTDIGTYTYCYECGNANERETGCINLDVTYTGNDLTLAEGFIYIFSIIFLAFFFGLLILLIGKLPSKDAQDEEGVILQINWLKYLRPVLWTLAWGLVLAMVFIVSNIGFAYLPGTMVASFFFMVWQLMFYTTLIMLPLYWIWIFTNIFKDREYKRMMERGVDIQGHMF